MHHSFVRMLSLARMLSRWRVTVIITTLARILIIISTYLVHYHVHVHYAKKCTVHERGH
jgi:hypothetical protein